MSVIGSNILAGASGQGGGYNLTKSLRFRSSAGAYLSRTFGTPTDPLKWTWSSWVKRSNIGSNGTLIAGVTSGSVYSELRFVSTDILRFHQENGATTVSQIDTVAVFRDPSAWYHVVCVYDSANATSANRLLIYINGVLQTTTAVVAVPPSQASNINKASEPSQIGNLTIGPLPFDGYLAEVNFIDGQALTPSSFGETSTTTGVWIPKKYTGTYGTNGFYLDFEDTSSTAALGYDAAGSNDWTVNNISLTAGVTYDSMNDVPTLTSATQGNYATINALDYNSTYLTLNDGNLHQTYAGVVAAAASRATMVIPTTGKYYWEVYINATGGGSGERIRVGITSPTTAISGNSIDGSPTSYLQMSDGKKRTGTTDSTYGAGFSATQYIQVLYDATAGAIYFGQNNNFANGTGSFNQTFSTATAAFTGLSGEFMPCFITYGGADIAVNFGQQPFAYTPPTGFVALNTFNLPAPPSGIGTTASSQADDYFNAVLYSGNNSTQNIAVGFQPDWVWSKCRNVGRSHRLSDAVRGSTRDLYSDTTDDEDNNGSITSFISTGFSLDNATGSTYNTSGETYVSWAWKANGAGSANTAGTIASTVSASTTAGFSIVTYTGVGGSGTTTVGHGLNVSPSMVIIKRRNSTADWATYHTGLTSTSYYLFLNSTAGQANYGSTFISPSSSTLTIDAGSSLLNASGGTYVAYCFAQVAGYSAFGSYTGNNASDGTFVYLGFRPKFIMIKSTSAGTEWVMVDSTRSTYNLVDTSLYANRAYSESTIGTVDDIDFLSNGFKLRNNTGYVNASQTYIYMAFAENPFKYANAR